MKPEFMPLAFEEHAPAAMLERAKNLHALMRRRRSVREFSSRAVDREIVENAILTAATAPSGANMQPWTFVLVGDAAVKQRIREAAEREERESYERRMPQRWLDDLEPIGTDWHKPFLTTCPWLIVVFAETYRQSDYGEAKLKNYYVQESVGIAVGFLLVALHHAGLACLTHTPSPMGFLREICRRPNRERPYLLIALGYPAPECRVPRLRRKSAPEILVEF